MTDDPFRGLNWRLAQLERDRLRLLKQVEDEQLRETTPRRGDGHRLSPLTVSRLTPPPPPE